MTRRRDCAARALESSDSSIQPSHSLTWHKWTFEKRQGRVHTLMGVIEGELKGAVVCMVVIIRVC